MDIYIFCFFYPDDVSRLISRDSISARSEAAFPLWPQIAMMVVRNRSNLNLLLIKLTVSEYLWFLILDIFSANFFTIYIYTIYVCFSSHTCGCWEHYGCKCRPFYLEYRSTVFSVFLHFMISQHLHNQKLSATTKVILHKCNDARSEVVVLWQNAHV